MTRLFWGVLAGIALTLHLVLINLAGRYTPFPLLAGVGISAYVLGYFLAFWVQSGEVDDNGK